VVDVCEEGRAPKVLIETVCALHTRFPPGDIYGGVWKIPAKSYTAAAAAARNRRIATSEAFVRLDMLFRTLHNLHFLTVDRITYKLIEGWRFWVQYRMIMIIMTTVIITLML
jgi:hypothetical protein